MVKSHRNFFKIFWKKVLTKGEFCSNIYNDVAKTTHFEKTWKKFKKSVDKVFEAMYNKQARSETGSDWTLKIK